MNNLDWANLGFSVREMNGVLVSRFKDGEWSEPSFEDQHSVKMSCFAGALHYSDSCFEGLKAFRGADGKARIFRPDENARRIIRSAKFLDMPYPSEEMFIKMCIECVNRNIEFLPPYGYNASMYIRPLLMGSNEQLNLHCPTEAIFIVMCIPAGSYSGAKNLSAVPAVISRDFDRAAPNGTGSYKLSSNYAPSFRTYKVAHQCGYQELLFLDSATHTKIDEFGSSNFFAIKDGKYITPLSSSVLPSITNKSLQTVAQDLGLSVEKREVPLTELSSFEEVNACGTAVVITPIGKIYDKPKVDGSEVTAVYEFGTDCGSWSKKLYDTLTGYQYGLIPDEHNWCIEL